MNDKQARGKTRRAEARAQKRAEAEARNEKANASMRDCGHVHGDAQVGRCQPR